MSLDEEMLERCADTGQIDYEEWPSIVNPLLDKLNYIAHNEFPPSRPFTIINPVLASQRQSDSDRFFEQPPTLPSQLQPTPTTPRTLPPVPPFPGSATSHIPDSQPPKDSSQEEDQKEQLPVELAQILNASIQIIRTTFSDKPPHTIQRLAELALYPKKHYKTLPAWLRALDRVVSVSSTANVFPLSDIPPQINGLVNGSDLGGILFANSSSNDTRNGYDRDALGSDESLGGALLTPIPWLKDSDLNSVTSSSTELDSSSKVEAWEGPTNDMDDMLREHITITQTPPDDDQAVPADTIADAQAIASVAQEQAAEGLVPQREDGAVTQGELIRMEQEAGVVIQHDSPLVGDMPIDDDDDDLEGVPHARGPDIVGTVDMGLVGGRERQVRISSPPEERTFQSVDANDAQEVLSGGKPANKSSNSSTEAGDSDEYVDLGTDTDMQIDKPGPQKESTKESESSEDGDIVLVDADGVMQDVEEGDKSNQSKLNVGASIDDSGPQ